MQCALYILHHRLSFCLGLYVFWITSMLKITLLPTIRDNGGVHKALEAAKETDDLVVTLLAGDRLKRNQPSKHFCLLNVHYSSKWRIPSLIVASFIWLFWLQIFKYKKVLIFLARCLALFA